MKQNIELTGEQKILIDQLPKMDLSSLARVVKNDWKKVYFGAEPYLDAMATLGSIKENYGYDSGKSVVIYFLSNATTYRGPIAKAVKAELKKRCGIK